MITALSESDTAWRALLLWTLTALFVSPANAQNQACSCTASACGNNAIGGDQGDVFTDIPPDNVKEYFQANANTGWTCTVPAKVRGEGGPLACFCKDYCGNGGIGADPNYFDLGLSQSTVDSSYGGGAPGNATGWLCGDYRGTFAVANDGGPITSAELTQKGYPYPNDLVANASHTQFANYAWRLFIASMQRTTATTSNGAARGAPDASSSFIDSGSGPGQSNPLVFESLYHRTEAFPFYEPGKQPASPIGQVPVYYPYYEVEGSEDKTGFPVKGQGYVLLDETNQIGQNFLYYQNSNDPNFPVLFMAKVNELEASYVRDKQPPTTSTPFVFPDNVVEVKTAWRRVSDIKNSDPKLYHQASATYFVSNAKGVPSLETDTFALIAIHIIQKTANYQYFVFTTFEHVDAVIRDGGGAITDPAYKTTYNSLSYGSGSPKPQASPTGAYAVNAAGQPTSNNTQTTYDLPPAGAISQDFTTVIQPMTITKEVNDVNNSVGALIEQLDGSSVWANYRLKGVQAVPNSTQTDEDYYLANIVVESSQPGIQLFRGNAGGGLPVETPPGSGTFVFTNNRDANNVSVPYLTNGSVTPANIDMGGCQGCHGVAQGKGRDFSFLAQASGGVGKELDSVPDAALTAEQQAAHNKRMAEDGNYDE